MRGLPETHASQGRASIADASSILNLVQSTGGMTSSRPWRVNELEIRQSELDLRLATLQQRAEDNHISASLNILREALRKMDLDSVTQTTNIYHSAAIPIDPRRVEIDNAKAGRQLVEIDCAMPEINKLYKRISILERRATRR